MERKDEMPNPQNTDPNNLNNGQDPNAGADPNAGHDPNAGGSNDPNAGADPNAGEDGGKGDGKKYSDAEVDGIVSKRLAREREKMEREIREAIAKEADDKRTEAEKLANMTELQKAQYEAKKIKAENDALKAERDLSQQMAIARKELSDAGIAMPDELLSMFVSSEAEKTSTAIDKLKELMPKFINDAVSDKLKRNPPTDPSTGNGGMSFGASFAEKYSKQKNGGKE
jgi:hypothetical protein